MKISLYNKYLLGQIGISVSFGFYYSLLSPTADAIAGTLGLGLGRLGYSTALAIFSPIAGCFIEKFQIKQLLIFLALARFLVWGVALPAVFFLFRAQVFFPYLFAGLMFIDGMIVSLTRLTDIDSAGVDLIANQYDLAINENIRNKLNAKFEAIGSCTSIFLAPAAAFFTIFIESHHTATSVLLILTCSAIAIPQLYSAIIYTILIPSPKQYPCAPFRANEFFTEFKSGLKITFEHKKIRWRVVFYSFERACLDVVQVIVIAEFAIRILAKGDITYGMLYTTALMALTHLGSILASYIMHTNWHIPEDDLSNKFIHYKMFFILAFFSGSLTLLFPLAAYIANDNLFWASVMVSCTCFLFGFCFTLVVLGFRNLMQGMLGDINASAQVFGVSGSIIMLVSGIVIALVSTLFVIFNVFTALLITCIVLFLLGTIEMLFGPALMFDL